LFTSGALAPLHFRFDEVHAAAPAPLCTILSGAMAPLGLYGFEHI
jgi:multicomponent Na+:H+ antiporter subunit D